MVDTRIWRYMAPLHYRRNLLKLLAVLLLVSLLLGFTTFVRVPLSTSQLHRPDTFNYTNVSQHVHKPPTVNKHTTIENTKIQSRIDTNKSNSLAFKSSKPNVNTSVGYTVVGNNEFYIYTVVAQNTTNASISVKLYFTGWEIEEAVNKTYLCCLIFVNGTTEDSVSSYKLGFWTNSKLRARQVVCDTKHLNLKEAPKWATLVSVSESCDNKKGYHVISYTNPVKTPSFAICGKIAYGKKDPRYLIEWMEYHKYLGVSKVVIYTYADLHEPARRVLKHYVDEGILETVDMPTVPAIDKFPRHFAVQNNVMWQDEKVPLFDTEQRLKPYTYIGVIDTDEFIVPKQPGVKNLVDLMGHLLTQYKDGGVFLMQTEVHILDWAKTNNDSDLMLAQYGNRTQSMLDCPKCLMVNDRIKEGSIWIHDTATKPGFTFPWPNATFVVLKHYRKCRADWLVAGNEGVPNKCHGGLQKNRDHMMDQVAKTIGPNIRRVKSLFNL